MALLGITFAVAMMLFQMGLKNALYKQVVGPLELLDGQVVIVGANYEYFGVGKGFPEVRLHQSRAVAEVESAEGIKLGCMSFKSVDDGRERDIFVIAFDPSKEVFLSDDIRGAQEFLKRDGAVCSTASRVRSTATWRGSSRRRARRARRSRADGRP